MWKLIKCAVSKLKRAKTPPYDPSSEGRVGFFRQFSTDSQVNESPHLGFVDPDSLDLPVDEEAQKAIDEGQGTPHRLPL